jgi:hypothetical protein
MKGANMQRNTVARNALEAAYLEAQRVANEIPNDLLFDIAELLEIYSRRPALADIPRSTMHELFQEAAPLLDTAEHLFNAALAGERVLADGRVF